MRFGTFSYNQARPWVSEKQAFEELLEQILLTERLGFDEAWFAEHHHSDYGLIASPNLMIASLAHRTKRLRLGNLVNKLARLMEEQRKAEARRRQQQEPRVDQRRLRAPLLRSDLRRRNIPIHADAHRLGDDTH